MSALASAVSFQIDIHHFFQGPINQKCEDKHLRWDRQLDVHLKTNMVNNSGCLGCVGSDTIRLYTNGIVSYDFRMPGIEPTIEFHGM